jgi:hypothetical protein
MQFQIDEHSERLRETSADIDDIALKMIDDTKKYESMFLKNLNESFKENCLSKVELVLNYGSQFFEFIVYC